MQSSEALRNGVLARLPDVARDELASIGARVVLKPGETLHTFGQVTSRLRFPLAGVISLTIPTSEGHNVEVALVGCEGVQGVNSMLGAAPDLEAISQVAGDAIEVAIERIPPELMVALRRSVEQYAAGLLIELAQTAACNRVHNVEERTARWLLHAADRARTSELRLTHEFMAMMLGVRRASVTVVVGGFQTAGLIKTERRLISIADREGLGEYTCECYGVIRDATSRCPD
jgi:CRP-like cAMP-binding protein